MHHPLYILVWYLSQQQDWCCDKKQLEVDIFQFDQEYNPIEHSWGVWVSRMFEFLEVKWNHA